MIEGADYVSDSTVGLGGYRLKRDIDWSPVAPSLQSVGVKLLGKDGRFDGVVFVFETRNAIIFKLKKPFPYQSHGINNAEIRYEDEQLAVLGLNS